MAHGRIVPRPDIGKCLLRQSRLGRLDSPFGCPTQLKNPIPMLFKTRSASVYGIEAHLVDVEVNITAGDGGPHGEFYIVGLPDTAVRESRSRVIAAVRNSGFSFPFQKITVNLAPADIK